jgi:uncharacterized protein
VSLNAIGMVSGMAFGFILGWAQMTDYDVIRNMLLLREPDVFLLIMSAIATAAVGIRVLRRLQVRTIVGRSPVTWKVEAPRTKHVMGGVLFGLGWSIAATCPGPLAAQLGRGQLVALFTMSGLLLGIKACDRVRGQRTSPASHMPLRDVPSVVGL